MVATATNLKTPTLPGTLDVNGQAMATPPGAVGIVGKLNGNELFVVRDGQTLSLRSGDWLLEGDRVVTTSAAEQTLFFAGDSAGSLRRIQFARGADFKIRNGEIYTTALMTSQVVTAGEALPGITAAIGSDDIPLEPGEAAQLSAEEAAAQGASSGFFGTPLAASAGTALGLGGGALVLASLGGGSDSSSEPTPVAMPSEGTPDNGNGSTGGDAGSGGSGSGDGTGDTPPPAAGGPLSSGGAQLDNAFADNPTGQTPPFSFADGAAMLEGLSPASASSGLLGFLPASLLPAVTPVTDALTVTSVVSDAAGAISSQASQLNLPTPNPTNAPL